MVGQIHIADASGDAVVISPGPDEEIAFTRKPTGEGYLLSTNFNVATQQGPVDFRWDTATSMLEMLSDGKALTPEFAGEILNAVHLKTLTTHTLLSNVIDLKKRDIYIYYMSQYNEAARLNIDEELARGQRIVEIRDLISAESAADGDASYQQFENRFFTAIVAVLTTGFGVVVGSIVWAARKFLGRNPKPRVISGIWL
jgi:hypothetical protein